MKIAQNPHPTRDLEIALYVMVSVRAWLVPPLVQPRSPVVPLGVWMVTPSVPGAVMIAVVSVTCNWVLLMICVLRGVPLIRTTEDDPRSLPVTVRGNPCCTCAKVTLVTEREVMDGTGRALPQRGFRALQPCSERTLSMKTLNCLSEV